MNKSNQEQYEQRKEDKNLMVTAPLLDGGSRLKIHQETSQGSRIYRGRGQWIQPSGPALGGVLSRDEDGDYCLPVPRIHEESPVR